MNNQPATMNTSSCSSTSVINFSNTKRDTTDSSFNENSGIRVNMDDCNNNEIAKKRSHRNSINSEKDELLTLVPTMKNLKLKEEEKSSITECLAGYIKAVIPPTETVVIQLASGSRLLDIGTMIFIRKINYDRFQSVKKYLEIGYISDIFGSINEPMYSLQLNKDILADSLRIDSSVYYLHNHSSTRYVSVKCDDEKRYCVIQNQIF